MTYWITTAVLFALLVYIIVGRFQSPQPNEIHLATGLFALIVAGCSFARGGFASRYDGFIDRSAEPGFFWLYIVVCIGCGLTEIVKFIVRRLEPPRP